MAARTTTLLLGFLITSAVAAACSTVQEVTVGGGGTGGAGNGGTGGSTAQQSTGLPCDIASTMQTYCQACHSSPPKNGAPNPLVTYDDLSAASPKGGTYAERSVIRMKDAAALMPPAGGVPAGEISGFEAWVTGGMPKGDCGAGGSGTGGTGTGGTGGVGPATGLPCDVADVLKACTGCHKSPPSGGAANSLLSWDDLMAPSPKGGTYADRSLIRMQDAAKPMPPAPNPMVSQAGIDTFQAWITAGNPKGECGTGGAGGGGPDPYDTPDTCTSGITWAGGEEDWGAYDKKCMHPGLACNDCHTNPGKYGLNDTGPSLWFGGTVYPTAHEYDECFGVDGTQDPITVEITDANGQVVTRQTNESGNFYLRKGAGSPTIVFPITARVISGGQYRAMSTAVNTGDCNLCHTLDGAQNAPGRIMAP